MDTINSILCFSLINPKQLLTRPSVFESGSHKYLKSQARDRDSLSRESRFPLKSLYWSVKKSVSFSELPFSPTPLFFCFLRRHAKEKHHQLHFSHNQMDKGKLLVSWAVIRKLYELCSQTHSSYWKNPVSWGCRAEVLIFSLAISLG